MLSSHYVFVSTKFCYFSSGSQKLLNTPTPQNLIWCLIVECCSRTEYVWNICHWMFSNHQPFNPIAKGRSQHFIFSEFDVQNNQESKYSSVL